MREAVIVAAVRTPIGKAKKGALRHVRPDDLGALVVREALARVPGLKPEAVDDVIFGCAIPEAEQGLNIARIIALRAGLPTTVPGVTVNRFCSSGLQAIADAAQRIMCGFADVIVAGGVESMSLVPMTGNKVSPNPYLVDHFPEVYMSMGHTAERVARRFGITREDQDAFALRSHRRAAAAIAEGRFRDEIVPVEVPERGVDEDGRLVERTRLFDTDEGVRPDTSLEALARLKPVFAVDGTVTAGNASQTSDGAAAVVVMAAEKAEELGVKPLGVFRSFAVAGVDPDIMGVGPVEAIPKALKLAGVRQQDVDLIELNEAFASQAVHCIRALELDEERVNVNGGAIALGHPLGCTGARQTVTLLYELARRKGRYGVVSMCIGGGMGAAGVFEALP
ncbi:acetyl-CoA C-acetyltransferase [Calditerricola satsumensis]|uniref:acetyl-CoA C-acyltransferase n=1 Tax=Calditerricola satsumensis TaxID=373054 RepID=A0A8J3BG68_9BACI|nr:acetyl-CoA C-acetyltransferase [Calditerricola satsumensis]GGK05333.1 acetyl-CoA acetyltransferase [Calditerricola satsumensis]